MPSTPHARLPEKVARSLEQAIARGGSNSQIMRELGVEYELVRNARDYLDDVAGVSDRAYQRARAQRARRARAAGTAAAVDEHQGAVA